MNSALFILINENNGFHILQLKFPTIPNSLISVISMLPCVPIYISSIKFSKKEVDRESNDRESPKLVVSVKKDNH